VFDTWVEFVVGSHFGVKPSVRISLQVLWFSSLLKNQQFKIPIQLRLK